MLFRYPAMAPASVLPPRVPEPASDADILREHFEYLLKHVADVGPGVCGCSDCLRYAAVRAVLFRIFKQKDLWQWKRLRT